MKPVVEHSWNLTESEAKELQLELSQKVIQVDQFNTIELIAGVDVAYNQSSNKLVAAVVILEANSLQIVESAASEDTTSFPYVPGLFSFRELPALIKAFEMLEHSPDLVVCDGQGIAHPRRFGLACHLGVLFDIPTIGCGKTRYVGEYEEPDQKRGSFSSLIDKKEVIGSVLRTQDQIKPIYVSVGHKISLSTAREYILKLCSKYRLPETTRQADQLVRKMSR